jgi:hypothetical protein
MTFDTFEPDLVNLLYPPQYRDAGWHPYYVYKWSIEGRAAVIRHYPPARVASHIIEPRMPPSSIGFRGLMVRDHHVPMSDQPSVLLCWIGIDVDAEDNDHVHLQRGTLADYISMLFVNEPVVTRSSKSGAGAHVLIPLRAPLEMSYDKAKRVAKAIADRYETYLNNEGIVTCVSGLPNMWLYTQGGKQATVGMTNDLYEPTIEELNPSTTAFPTVQHVENSGPPQFSGMAARCLNTLVEAGVMSPEFPKRTQINVGRVKRALANMGVELETRSKCRPDHEHEVNGYIELSEDGTVKVISNPDNNSVILTLVSS